MQIDPNDLTIGEMEQIEDIAGEDVTQMFAGGMPSAKSLKALVYVFGRRDNPDFTLEDAAAVKIVDVFDDTSDEVPPTDGND